MAYVLGQYNNYNSSGNNFLTPITSGLVADRIEDEVNKEGNLDGDMRTFQNECIYFSSGNFSNTKFYYFHGKIRRMSSSQIFYIKLKNKDATGLDTDEEQYIKTLSVTAKIPENQEWQDIEFIFCPIKAFDCLVFELKRTDEDFIHGDRYPVVVYQEISEIKNILNELDGSPSKLIKIGVQSKPSLMMCINGEEIRTSRVGIYELKNGIITINFFSVCSPLLEQDDTMKDSLQETYDEIVEIDKRYGDNHVKAAEAKDKANFRRVFVNTAKSGRRIDDFVLDYLYKS